jgi:hypothetical protein
MKWLNFRKTYLSALLVLVLGFSLFFCCRASWQSVLGVDNLQFMSNMPGCNMNNGLDHQTQAPDHSQMAPATLVNFIKFFSIAFIILIVVSILVEREKKLAVFDKYYQSVRDRYGGFVIFNIFSSLFRVGILNSKVF